ncbi:MAG: hypothetical protein JSR39_04025 [Verrucomicrobia bacterium]|nr:hypothetical protein [Verrucomicrobiota bacterium]
MAFENLKRAPFSKQQFYKRVLLSILLGVFTVSAMIGTGMIGFHTIEGLSWIDSYLQAALFFGGMGTEHEIKSWEGKLFAGTYAICCPFSLVAAISIMLMPLLRRFLHKFHIDLEKK